MLAYDNGGTAEKGRKPFKYQCWGNRVSIMEVSSKGGREGGREERDRETKAGRGNRIWPLHHVQKESKLIKQQNRKIHKDSVRQY